MPEVRITQPIRYLSEELPVGRHIDVPEVDAQQLVDAGQAERVVAAAPQKTQPRNQPKE